MQFEEMFQLSILLTPLKKMYILFKMGEKKKKKVNNYKGKQKKSSGF